MAATTGKRHSSVLSEYELPSTATSTCAGHPGQEGSTEGIVHVWVIIGWGATWAELSLERTQHAGSCGTPAVPRPLLCARQAPQSKALAADTWGRHALPCGRTSQLQVRSDEGVYMSGMVRLPLGGTVASCTAGSEPPPPRAEPADAPPLALRPAASKPPFEECAEACGPGPCARGRRTAVPRVTALPQPSTHLPRLRSELRRPKTLDL